MLEWSYTGFGVDRLIILAVVGITTTQAFLLVPNMFSHEEYQDYIDNILPYVYGCEINQLPQINDQITRNPLKYWLHCVSFNLTGYPNTLLILFAIGLLPLVYCLGYYITNDKRVGLIAIGAMFINPYYSTWANSGTYDQVWAFFLLLSTVLIFKHQGTSILSFIISVLGKTIALTYFPLWLYSIWKINHNRNTIIVLSSLVGLVSFLAIFYNIVPIMIGSEIGFFPENIPEAATSLISTFWIILPALIGLIAWNKGFKARDGTKNKNLVLVWILGVFLATILIHLFTNQQTYGYRYAPLAAFLSVYVGQVIVDTFTYIKEEKKKSLYKPQA